MSERELGKLWTSIEGLKDRLKLFLSQAGGRLTGQVTTGAWMQFEERDDVDTPASGNIRLYARNGSPPDICAIYDDGTIVDLRPRFRQFGLRPKTQGRRGTCSVFATCGVCEYE